MSHHSPLFTVSMHTLGWNIEQYTNTTVIKLQRSVVRIKYIHTRVTGSVIAPL